LGQCAALPDHCHQRHEAGASPDQQNRIYGRLRPKEMATERTANFDFVTNRRDVVKKRRNFGIRHALDSYLDDRGRNCR